MDRSALIEWIHNWRRDLVQYLCSASDDPDQISEISRNAQRILCRSVISQMLEEKDIQDAGQRILDATLSCHSSGVDLIAPKKMLTQIQRELSEMDISELPFEILSDIHESYVAQKLAFAKTGVLECLPERRLRKVKGVYYTPPYIVRHIVNHTLGKYLWRTEDGQPSGKAKARTPEEIRHIRILDPACGSGCFLTYAFDVLADFYAFYDSGDKADWSSLIFRNHLYGIDIDSGALDVTRAILMLKALEKSGKTSIGVSELNIKRGNFLVPDNSDAPDFLDMGFTMILGNPPYGAKLSADERKVIKAKYETHKSFDSSSLFIERAIKKLEDAGILGFIVPKSLSYVVSWEPIRKFILDKCRIMEIADAQKAFKGVLLEQMVIIAQRDGKLPHPTTVSIIRPENSVISHSLDNDALQSERFSIWFSSRRIRNIVSKMWEHSVPLGNVAEIWNGLNVWGKLTLWDNPTSEDDQPCLRGKDIQRYHLRKDAKYININDTASFYPGLELFRRPRIIAQDIVAHIFSPTPRIKLTATIDRFEDRPNINTVTNIASFQYPLEYLCGILNSSLISWYAYDFIYNRSIRTMHFRSGYADYIPIRCMDSFDHLMHKSLIESVNQIIALHDEGASQDEITEMDSKINKLVYQLYGIAATDVTFLREHAGLYTMITDQRRITS